MKRKKITEHQLTTQLTISLVTIAACVAALLGSAYAWFETTVHSETGAVTSAAYTLTVTDGGGAAVTEAGYTFAEDGTQVFTLTASSDANAASTGFCRVTVGGTVYTTAQIAKGTALELTVTAPTGTQVTFAPQWGTSVAYANHETLYGGAAAIELPLPTPAPAPAPAAPEGGVTPEGETAGPAVPEGTTPGGTTPEPEPTPEPTPESTPEPEGGEPADDSTGSEPETGA